MRSDARKRELRVLPTIEHTIRWEFNDGWIEPTTVCHAAPDADCRLEAADYNECQCERWGEIVRHEDGTISHRLDDGYADPSEPAVLHRLAPGGDCNVCLFIDESGCANELAVRGTHFVLGEVPIKPVWLDDGCDWEVVT